MTISRVVEASHAAMRLAIRLDVLVVLVGVVDGAIAPHEVAIARVGWASGAGLARVLDHVDPEVVPVGIHWGENNKLDKI